MLSAYLESGIADFSEIQGFLTICPIYTDIQYMSVALQNKSDMSDLYFIRYL